MLKFNLSNQNAFALCYDNCISKLSGNNSQSGDSISQPARVVNNSRLARTQTRSSLPDGMRSLRNSVASLDLTNITNADSDRLTPISENTSVSRSPSTSGKDVDATFYTSKLVYPITDKTHPIHIFISQLPVNERRKLSRQLSELRGMKSPDIMPLNDVDVTMLLLMRMIPEQASSVLSMSLLHGSENLKELLQNSQKPVTVTSCIIGAGINGTAAAAANGNASTIVVDKYEVVGGGSFGGRHLKWWGQHPTPTVGFAINSTSRMPDKSVPTGGGYDFNPSPMQIAKDVKAGAVRPGVDTIAVRHLSGDSWPDASELARTILLNLTSLKQENNTQFLLGFSVVSANYNQNQKLYEITAQNRTGETVRFNALSITQAAGLGTAKIPNLTPDANVNPRNSFDSKKLKAEIERTSLIIEDLNSPDPQVRIAATNSLGSVKVLTPQQWFDILKYSQQPSKLYHKRIPGFAGDGDSILTTIESKYRIRGKQQLHDSAGNYAIKKGAWFSSKYDDCNDFKDQARSRYSDVQTVAGRIAKENGLIIYDRLDSLSLSGNNQFIYNDKKENKPVYFDFLVVGTGFDAITQPVFQMNNVPQVKNKIKKVNDEPVCFEIGPNAILVGPATGPEVNQAKKSGETTLGIKENTASVFLRATDAAKAQVQMMNDVAQSSEVVDKAFFDQLATMKPAQLNFGFGFQSDVSHKDTGLHFNEQTVKFALANALSKFDLSQGVSIDLNLSRLDPNRIRVGSNNLNADSFNQFWNKIPEAGRNHILNCVSLVGEETTISVSASSPKNSTKNNQVTQTISVDIQASKTFSDIESARSLQLGSVV